MSVRPSSIAIFLDNLAVLMPVTVVKFDRHPLTAEILAQTDAADWVKEWLLAIHCSTLAFPLSSIIAARHGTMSDNSIIPEGNTAGLPLPAYCQIVCGVEMSIKCQQQFRTISEAAYSLRNANVWCDSAPFKPSRVNTKDGL
jgi:hypothetical protein